MEKKGKKLFDVIENNYNIIVKGKVTKNGVVILKSLYESNGRLRTDKDNKVTTR